MLPVILPVICGVKSFSTEIKVGRRQQRIKDIGAEICDIDRMLHSLQVRLLTVHQKQRSV